MDHIITNFRGNKNLFLIQYNRFFFTFVDTDNITQLQSIFYTLLRCEFQLT